MAVREEVGRDPHGRPRRVDVVAARAVLLEDVVLDGAAQVSSRHALLLRDELVEQEQQRRRRVDRHRGRDLVQRDAVEEQLHVGDRVDRDTGPPHLAHGARIVGVVPELRREVEGDRETGLATLEQVPEALVRLLGGREPGVLPDRPRTAAVHVLVGPAGEGVLAGKLELETLDVVLGVDGLDLDPGVGLAPFLGGCHRGIVRRVAH